MKGLTNYVKFNANNTLTGNVASIAFDIPFTGRANRSENPKAPVYRLFAKTPLGNDVEIGAIWQKENRDGDPYYSVLINTGHSRINANLGRMAGQDDEDLYAIIPWE